jgi:hypothetical protein
MLLVLDLMASLNLTAMQKHQIQTLSHSLCAGFLLGGLAAWLKTMVTMKRLSSASIQMMKTHRQFTPLLRGILLLDSHAEILILLSLFPPVGSIILTSGLDFLSTLITLPGQRLLRLQTPSLLTAYTSLGSILKAGLINAGFVREFCVFHAPKSLMLTIFFKKNLCCWKQSDNKTYPFAD